VSISYFERDALDELHDKVVVIVGRSHIVERYDARVREMGGRRGFCQKGTVVCRFARRVRFCRAGDIQILAFRAKIP